MSCFTLSLNPGLAGLDGEATEDTVAELVDPDTVLGSGSVEEQEVRLEKEYGLTKIVLEVYGSVEILLLSIQRSIRDSLRRIRRDDVKMREDASNTENRERAIFRKSAPCQGLTLMRHCAKLSVNRRKLLQARAPTVLLSLLLDVLKALEETEGGSQDSKSNPTADLLQDVITSLACDISQVGSFFEREEAAQDASSLPLLLHSIETSSLGAPLRNVIAKLLPFLTYGQTKLSQSLAQHFSQHIVLSSLSEKEDQTSTNILMNTFVETAISLPANEVCHVLRSALIDCGFVKSLCEFMIEGIPLQPPTWSTALWPKGVIAARAQDAWKAYIERDGVRTALKIATSLCKEHDGAQMAFCQHKSLVQSCHWLEATSDNSDLNISMNGIGLLAETLLDELVGGSSDLETSVESVRKATRMRKKELAEERRNMTLHKMGSFGPTPRMEQPATTGSVVDGAASSIYSMSAYGALLRKGLDKGTNDEKPAWLAEMEMIEEEEGLVCAICQEGHNSQPSELLGLYAFVRKVTVPLDKCGSRASIDGSSLLNSLPSIAPTSFAGEREAEEWFPVGKAAGQNLSPTSSICMSSGSSRQASVFTTTVSAGNGIHVSCHMRALQADRTHPKAPKSEWEGARLRNGRVDCNIILPLVSSRSSKVSLIAVDSALSDHQAAVSNLLGATPKSMLWTILFDMYFLLLRVSYGEPWYSDCGGGSLASNCLLLLHEMLLADMFEKDAQIDQPEQSQHARGLSSGFLAACAILLSGDVSDCDTKSLTSGIADAAPMACLTCILFHNNYDDSGSASEVAGDKAHPHRRWVVGRKYFLRGLVICAGRRRALGVENSGCLSSRATKQKLRPSSFADWDASETDCKAENTLSGSNVANYRHSLRPMLTFFALMEQLSVVFSSSMEEGSICDHAEKLAKTAEDCLRCKNIDELLARAKVDLDPQEIVDLVKSGLTVC